MIRVQMIGTQRSGSNLLRLMLDSGGALFGPPSAHELRDLLPLSSLYQPLHDTSNQARLARDVVRLIDANALPWPDGHVDADHLLKHVAQATVAHFVVALYDQGACRGNRSGWLNKCLENVHLADPLERTGMRLRYVHLVRDPRDVAASFRRAPIGPKDARVIATSWSADQLAALRLAARFPARVTRVHYEDLVTRPDEVLTKLSEWLGVPFDAAAGLRFYEREDVAAAAQLSPLWANLGQKASTERIGSHAISGDGVEFFRAVEEIAFAEMTTLGYEPRFATAGRSMSPVELGDARQNDRRLRIEAEKTQAGRDQSAHFKRVAVLDALHAELRAKRESAV